MKSCRSSSSSSSSSNSSRSVGSSKKKKHLKNNSKAAPISRSDLNGNNANEDIAGFINQHENGEQPSQMMYQFNQYMSQQQQQLTQQNLCNLTNNLANSIQQSDISNSHHQLNNVNVQESELMDQIERKESMFNQLGNFLNQMKEESSSTNDAWKKKLAENTELKLINKKLLDEINTMNANKSITDGNVDELKKLLNDNIEKYKKELNQNELNLIQIRELNSTIEEKEAQFVELKELIQQREEDYNTALAASNNNLEELRENYSNEKSTNLKKQEELLLLKTHFNSEKGQFEATMLALNDRAKELEREKAELGSHIWNISKELEKTIEDLSNKNKLIEELEKFSNKNQNTISALKEEITQLSACNTNCIGEMQSLKEEIILEKSQKEELNQGIHDEISKYESNIQQLNKLLAAQKEELQSNVDNAKLESQKAIENQKLLERKLKNYSEEADDMRHEIEVIGEENTRLREISDNSINDLQELDTKYNQLLEEFNESKEDRNMMHQSVEEYEAFIRSVLSQVDSESSEDKSISNTKTQIFEEILTFIKKAKKNIVDISTVTEENRRLSQCIKETIENKDSKYKSTLADLEKRNAELNQVQMDAQALASTLQKVQLENQEQTIDYKKKMQELNRISNDAQEKSSIEIIKLQRSLESQKNRAQTLENEKRELLQEAELLNKEMESLHTRNSDNEVSMGDIKAIKESLEVEIEDLKHENESARMKIDEISLLANSKEKELNELCEKISDENKVLKVNFNELQVEGLRGNKKYSELNSKLENDILELKSNFNHTNEELESKKNKLEEAAVLISNLRHQLNDLEKRKSSEESQLRKDYEKYQQAAFCLGKEKQKLECSITSLNEHLDIVKADLTNLKEDKKKTLNSLHDLDHDLVEHKNTIAQLQSDISREIRTRRIVESDLENLSTENTDMLRQIEVLKRTIRVNDAKNQEEVELLQKDVDLNKQESLESNSLLEEVQKKLQSVQSAANSTINELMNELKNNEDILKNERQQATKQGEMYRTQLNNLEDEIDRRDRSQNQNITTLKDENQILRQSIVDLQSKISLQQENIEKKRKESEKLNDQFMAKSQQMHDMERKINPIKIAKENIEKKFIATKQALEIKVRELNEIEERLTSELHTTQRQKRDIEIQFQRYKEEHAEDSRPASSSELQSQRENKSLKVIIERTKTELLNANKEVSVLKERLEELRETSNSNIVELSTKIHQIEQDYEARSMDLTRKFNLEKERNEDLENEKSRLRQLLRTHISADEDINWNTHELSGSAREKEFPVRNIEKEQNSSKRCNNNNTQRKSGLPTNVMDINSTNLTDVPVALLRAQIGLELSNNLVDETLHTSPRGSKKSKPAGIDPDDPLSMGTRDKSFHLEMAPLNSNQETDAVDGNNNFIPTLELQNISIGSSDDENDRNQNRSERKSLGSNRSIDNIRHVTPESTPLKKPKSKVKFKGKNIGKYKVSKSNDSSPYSGSKKDCFKRALVDGKHKFLPSI